MSSSVTTGSETPPLMVDFLYGDDTRNCVWIFSVGLSSSWSSSSVSAKSELLASAFESFGFFENTCPKKESVLVFFSLCVDPVLRLPDDCRKNWLGSVGSSSCYRVKA